MLSLKQIEAFYWAARLCSFSSAARMLCMTQSALSKRIAELETELAVVLFDRSAYRPTLTDQGRRLLESAEHMLELRQQMYALGDVGTPVGHVAFGVTELVAGTWLASWVAQMRRDYPEVILEPFVDLTDTLSDKLRQGLIDMAVMPLRVADPGFTSILIGEVAFSMMAAPGLVPDDTLSSDMLESLPTFAQSGGSGLTAMFDGWTLAHGLTLHRVLASNSLVAISELVLAGLGMALLPVTYYQSHLDAGRLRVVRGPVAWPSLPYYLSMRTDVVRSPVRALRQVLTRDTLVPATAQERQTPAQANPTTQDATKQAERSVDPSSQSTL